MEQKKELNNVVEATTISKNATSSKKQMKLIVLFLAIICYSSTLSGQSWKSALNKTKEYANKSYDDGGKYKGQLSNDSRVGLGIYYWSSGSYYIGNWTNGDRNGYGMTLAPEGQSVNNCNNSVVYVGDWSSGNKSGEGTCYDKDGNLIYYGKFSNDKPTEAYPTTGSYSAYKFKTISYDSGYKYIGETKDGKRRIVLW